MGNFPKALEQLQSLLELHCSSFIATLILVLVSGIETSKRCQERQIRLAAAAEGWCLRRLKRMAGHLKSFMGSVGLPEQHQSSDLAVRRQFQTSLLIRMVTPKLQKRSFIILTSRGVTEEIGRESQELGTLRKCFMRESLIRSTIQTSLEGSRTTSASAVGLTPSRRKWSMGKSTTKQGHWLQTVDSV